MGRAKTGIVSSLIKEHQKLWTAQAKALAAARGMGIEIENLGRGMEYDAVVAPFYTWAGQIGQFTDAMNSFPYSANFDAWCTKRRELEVLFVNRFNLYFRTSPTPVLPPRWIKRFFDGLSTIREMP
jgi:hypothetical protein